MAANGPPTVRTLPKGVPGSGAQGSWRRLPARQTGSPRQLPCAPPPGTPVPAENGPRKEPRLHRRRPPKAHRIAVHSSLSPGGRHPTHLAMAPLQAGNFTAAVFILVGFPGMEAVQFWLAFPLCCLLLLAVLGNGAIIYIVRVERSLHEPMYLFLCMLAAIDTLISLATIPKMMAIFWLQAPSIAFDACLVQMFCIHSLSGMESTILLAMAFDRYIAICHPLSHASLLSTPRIAKIGLGAVLRGAALMAPLPVFIKRLPFCRSNVLSHSYCLHQDVMKLACADIKVNVIYGLVVIIFAIGVDSLLISVSYFFILRAALSLTQEARLKALGTCISHICAVFLFYVPFIGLSMVHRFSKTHGSHVHVIMANVHLLVPPVLNPLVYGVKTKQIRLRILRVLGKAAHR
ncbi:olfactory receptor 51E1-like [Paroedura picta]|uniref:olfactory receptor 51E1-like n=1 Tax=Paroedura picta TaxID=143630 RepID=UPI004055AADA